MIEKLQAYANDTRTEPPYLYLTDEGRMTLSYDNSTRVTIADDIDAHFPHEYTAENGYTYRNGQVYKPDGTELFE